jgi:hypothetical protein
MKRKNKKKLFEASQYDQPDMREYNESIYSYIVRYIP